MWLLRWLCMPATLLVLVLLVMVLSLQPAIAHSAETDPKEFSEAIAARLLDQIRDGLEGQNSDRVLGVFDAEKMANYPAFRDQIRALFQAYESFRTSCQIAQSWPEGEKGLVIVNFQLEAVSRGESAPAERRSAQIRIEMERGRKGWRIVALEPRGFFS